MHRFYAPGMTADGGRVVLDAVESAHLARVLRLRAGDHVRSFDGRGLERDARVATARPNAAELELGDAVRPRPEARVRVELAAALLKADKYEGVLRDAVMLGVAGLQPLVTERCDVPASAAAAPARRERWHRIAVAAAKQSGRAVVPPIREPVPLDACLDLHTSRTRLLLVEPSVVNAERVVASGPAWARIADALVLVGPEGGWAPAEVEAARANGCRVISLGSRTLRADAAPLVALAVLQFLWGDL